MQQEDNEQWRHHQQNMSAQTENWGGRSWLIVVALSAELIIEDELAFYPSGSPEAEQSRCVVVGIPISQ